ncbi:hypothetical protein K469DRAFT_633197 [Zopfia rhizophila CBS 207.26]|uniref:Uncharacterized protein n=1 Tax=Zopfia rhizophila CBS 207.26 TaxID=1314779 RepID=A0A6A6E2D9_9PEZI|nr:hypothetical protein K469DRAFT_633197 [Zopfia rhizophila CBS 207.26]
MVCQDVHCGVWINWNKGRYFGSTVTLPQESGFILIAFLALFVRFAGSHLWGVVCFTIHQIRATSSDQDDFYHQTQVLLRNASSESSVLWNMTMLWWSRKRGNIFLRCLPVVLVSALHVTALGAAGLLSSRFITVGDVAVAKGSICGWMAEISTNADLTNDTIGTDTANALLVAGRWTYKKSLTYSHTCYREHLETRNSLCQLYTQPRIESSVNMSSTCPFTKEICDSSAISIDTGFIDSDIHLGINSPKQDRISCRKVMTCAPLLGERYTDGWLPFPEELPNAIPNDTLKSYYFGPSTSPDGLIYSNSTFSIGNFSNYFVQIPYDFWLAKSFVANTSESTFLPIEDLSVRDSDIFIIGLRNMASYISEVKDPWFNASYRIPESNPPLFVATNDLSFMACAAQYQFCSNSDCSPLTGLYGITPDRQQNPKLSPIQLAVFQLLWKAVWASQLSYTILLLREELLLAQDYQWDRSFMSAPLPDNHWKNEIWNFHNVSLALLQRRVVEFASPPDVRVRPGVSSLQHIVRPELPELLKLCNAVKIRTTAYSNFSVLALVLTIVGGLLIIGLNLTLSTVVEWAQKRSRKYLYKRLEWIETSDLHLHRMACEGRGIGPWNGREGIPRMMVAEQRFSLSGLSLKGWPSGAGS